MAGTRTVELDHTEGLDLVDQVAGFGRPYPILVLTGGDCLLRDDVFELVAHATELGVPVCLSPSVTPMVTPESIARMASSRGEGRLALARRCLGPTHDGIRGIRGHFDETFPAIRAIVDAGIKLQINTTVMSGNVHELPDIAKIVKDHGVDMWEVFFLVHVGRGEATGAISPQEHEDVCHFLFDASHHGFVVRTVRPRSSGGWCTRGAPVARPPARRCTPSSPVASACCSARGGSAPPRTPPPPVTARGSCSSPTTARSPRPASCRSASARYANGPSPRSTATTPP